MLNIMSLKWKEGKIRQKERQLIERKKHMKDCIPIFSSSLDQSGYQAAVTALGSESKSFFGDTLE